MGHTHAKNLRDLQREGREEKKKKSQLVNFTKTQLATMYSREPSRRLPVVDANSPIPQGSEKERVLMRFPADQPYAEVSACETEGESERGARDEKKCRVGLPLRASAYGRFDESARVR